MVFPGKFLDAWDVESIINFHNPIKFPLNQLGSVTTSNYVFFAGLAGAHQYLMEREQVIQ